MPKSKHRKRYYEKKKHQNRSNGADVFATLKPHEQKRFIEQKKAKEKQEQQKLKSFKNEQQQKQQQREERNKDNNFFGRAKRYLGRLF